MVLSIKEYIVEYLILDIFPGDFVGTTWTCVSFKQISIVRIFQEKLYIFLQINMNGNWCLMLYVLV